MVLTFRYTTVWLMLLLLIACGSSVQSSRVVQPSSEIVLSETSPTALTTLAPTTLQVTPTTALPPNWITASWQGLLIPLVPQAQWQELPFQDGANQVAPVVAQGAVTYPPKTQGSEQPHGPIFTLYTFSDSLDRWIELQQQRGSAFVDTSTIQDATLASKPAKRYQPLVTGTCNSGFYIAKADATHLLEVATECIDTEPYTTIINQLRFQTP